MDIEQTDLPTSKEANKASNDKKANHHNRHKAKSPASSDSGLQAEPKSLRESWDETLNQKKSDHHHEGSLTLDHKTEDEIDLHPDAHQLHERIQEGRDDEEFDKPDPIWEPYKVPETAEQMVKDLAAPAAEIRAETPIDTGLASPLRPEVVPPQPEPAPPTYALLPRPESSEAAINPNVMASQPFLRESTMPQPTEQTPPPAPSYKSELPKEAQEIMNRLQVPGDHHLEQSAWHNIEVDNKTGQALEQPSFTYGEEFKHEQQQEATKDDLDEEDVAVASGQLAVGITDLPALNPNLSITPSDSSASQSSASSARPDTNTSPGFGIPDVPDGLGSSLADPVLWIILVVIVFAIIFAIVV